MIEIWEEFTFQAISQRLTDQVRKVIKKSWVSDLEILEIHERINRKSRQHYPNTIINIPNTEKQEPSNKNELQSNNDQNTTHSNHTEQTLIQEEEMNIEKLKRIRSEKKTILPSLRNQDWKTVKAEMEKINKLLTVISTNDITELNELILVRVKLVCEKISVSLKKNTNRNSKPKGEIWLESVTKSKNAKTEEEC